MKILVIQITRLGDVLCTMPILSALRRDNPDAEIHFLVRSGFSEVAERCRHIDHLWRLDSKKILGGLVTQEKDVTDAAGDVADLVSSLRAEKYDRVINLSFSPSSSYLTHLIAGEKISTVGYTRTADFFLQIPDEASCYFRSHVGSGKSNRLHVIDMMALVAGVQINEEDTYLNGRDFSANDRSGIVCHIGASQTQKTWPAHSWAALISRLLDGSARPIALIGSESERELANTIVLNVTGGVQNGRLLNLVGETKVTDLVHIIGGAELFIGADSGPLHIANLTDCPSLNLSLGDVRFWETGPTVIGSRVLVSADPQALTSDLVEAHAQTMLTNLGGKIDTLNYYECTRASGIRYDRRGSPERQAGNSDAKWDMIEWLYFDGPKPTFTADEEEALRKIYEVCELTDHQLRAFYKHPERPEIVQILDRLDEILQLVRKGFQPVAPLLDAFFTQKENIPPLMRDEVFYLTRKCYSDLYQRTEKLLGLTTETEFPNSEIEGMQNVQL